MSFRKRSVPLSARSSSSSAAASAPSTSSSSSPRGQDSSSNVPREPADDAPTPSRGVRPSPSDGRPTISTGTPSLDMLLAGHAGLPLGTSLLISENGTTDYAGVICRYFGAEGVVQAEGAGQGSGQKASAPQSVVHVVGVGEGWGRDLPGLTGVAAESDGASTGAGGKGNEKSEKMKIAWRYEKLGAFGEGSGAGARRGVPPSPSPGVGGTSPSSSPGTPPAFCHAFDLTKRLTIPSPSPINFIPPPSANPSHPPFAPILQTLHIALTSTPPTTIHRLIIPNLLSPAIYPTHASSPHHLLPFLHALRALLRQHPSRFAALITLPIELYPRSSGLVRWIELLSDGVMELTPFPHHVDSGTAAGAATAQEEQPQGLVKIHRLPIFHERGGGGSGASSGGTGPDLGDDLAFTVSRRRFAIKPFSLPPMEGDQEAQQQQQPQSEAQETDMGQKGAKSLPVDASKMDF
ncbi:MAG: hypothetical protein M4579_006623 [Chaenotheca gracillima]|nr:MAG: hypothetical protein M4579_006623 [Chaenotheca gracillima]